MTSVSHINATIMTDLLSSSRPTVRRNIDNCAAFDVKANVILCDKICDVNGLFMLQLLKYVCFITHNRRTRKMNKDIPS